MKKTPEEIRHLLKELVDVYDKEDRSVRQRQIRKWKQLKFLWEGITRTYYSEIAHDWRIVDDDYSIDDTQQAAYDRPVNVFRAYLESIIAALSITIPPIKCFPDDAENTLDIMTAKAGDKASSLIDKHNDAGMKWLHGLFTFCTEGMTACYIEKKCNSSYGTWKKEKYEEAVENHQYTKCPSCGYNLNDQIIPSSTNAIPNQDGLQAQSTGQVLLGNNQIQPSNSGGQNPEELLDIQEDKYDPDESDVDIQNKLGMELCPSCLQQVIPQISQEPLTITRLVGITNEPKTRINFDINGGLYIKVPNYARNQEECLYLLYSRETNFVNTFELFEDDDYDDIRDLLQGSTAPKSNYEEWARLSPQYNGEYPKDLVTVRKCWLRPQTFNRLDKDDRDRLKKRYPNGVYVCFVNDHFASAMNESLDDHWELTYNPLANAVHYDPLGLLLVSVQELTNDLISLTTQTIEHGIPQTFADPGVLNFPAYRQLEATPGGIYEATPKSGKSVGDAFYEVKTATLSQEVLPFLQQLQSLGQLVSGALPSLFGGQLENNETASGYSMSRAQALQRLQNTWKMFTSWWKNIHGKAVPMFLETIQEDERNVERRKDGSFFNTFIRKSELEGKIGKVELDTAENLPVTWAQKKDVIMQLLQAANPQVLAILAAPENLPFIREAIGLEGWTVPGEDDRNKQYDEIKELLNSEPIGDPMSGQLIPSVEVDQEYDNHEIEFEICRNWVISEEGRQAKIDNPMGYQNVLLHGKLHLLMAREEAIGVPPGGENNPNGPPGEKVPGSTQVNEESDVQTA